MLPFRPEPEITLACLPFQPDLGKGEIESQKSHRPSTIFNIRCNDLAAKYESENDDYNVIMTKALADRLAEAFAEALHESVRTELWGYCSQEGLSPSDLHRIKYQVTRHMKFVKM